MSQVEYIKDLYENEGLSLEPVWYLFVLGFLSRFFVRQGVRLRTAQHGGKYAKKTGAKRYQTGS